MADGWTYCDLSKFQYYASRVEGAEPVLPSPLLSTLLLHPQMHRRCIAVLELSDPGGA